jgi:PhnB protein
MKMTDKTGKVQPIPADYGSITPYFVVRGVPQFIDFLVAAFGAVERGRVPNADGTIGHAEVWIGNSVIQMFDARGNWRDFPNFTTLYVEDCDAVFQRALDAGATEITKLGTNAWGDRGARIRDPFGNIWWIQSHVEDVEPAEMERRMGEPFYLTQMKYAQETLDNEISSRS